jgi:catechol 2,3-dioxygenase-like lactoylglutathione lyase family enzyme
VIVSSGRQPPTKEELVSDQLDRIPRRTFLARSAAALGAAAAAPLLGVEQARAAATHALGGNGKGELGLVGMDHVGITVPDLNQAIEWFEDILGARAPLTFGPFAGSFLEGALDVVPGTRIDQITTLRIGHSANIELFEYEAPGQRQDMPLNSDWTGHHVAFYVTDIAEAVEYMDSRGVTRMFGPFTLTAGPAAGQSINYFRTPWGGYIEFISYPQGMAYEVPGVKPLWSPKRNGLDSEVTKVPGLLGIDHVGITVPDLAVASDWLERNLGFFNPLTFGPFSDSGDFMKLLVDVDPRAVVNQIRMLRGGNGPGIELFDYSAPGQDHAFRRNSDWGGHHVALYVRHIEKGVDYLQSKANSKLDGPLTLTDGPAAGQSINYFETPFGTNVELISYPHGMAYEQTAQVPLWDPRDNHP